MITVFLKTTPSGFRIFAMVEPLALGTVQQIPSCLLREYNEFGNGISTTANVNHETITWIGIACIEFE